MFELRGGYDYIFSPSTDEIIWLKKEAAMQKFKRIMRVCISYALVVVIAGGYPLTAMALDAAPSPTYTYDPITGHWNTTTWEYDSQSGTYKAKSTPAPPPENTQIVPSDPETTNEQPSTSTTDTSTGTSNAGVNIQNDTSSVAQSGDAGVSANASAGNATSGNAAATTTTVSTVHSTVGGDTVGVAHFTSDIYGNVTGDITLSSAIGDLSAQQSNAAATTTVNNSAAITNNVSVDAGSGDANVNRNTSAGNATTGSANAVANVINLINSIIAANKSFVGTINIYGNLNGDILISPEFIPQLLASNAQDASASVVSNDTQSIVNNVQLSATSGSAEVTNNTSAGQATTGTATTNLTILNLSGHQVVASNSLLVFVNVLGTWVGIIVDAPGATAAMLGSGVTDSNGGQDITANNNSQITNNIDVTAHSGNAGVTGNTSAGNASSGNATASANILNVNMSSFGLSDWFGILFINVFGHWDGSFGVDTASGDQPASSAPPVPTDAGQEASPPFSLGFVPKTSSNQQSSAETPILDDSSGDTQAAPEVLGTTTTDNSVQNQVPKTTSAARGMNPFLAILLTVLFLSILATMAVGLTRRSRLA